MSPVSHPRHTTIRSIKVGDLYPTTFSDSPDGMSTVLEIFPYTGLYKEHFSHVLRLTAPKTMKGWAELPVLVVPKNTPRTI